MIHCEKGSVGYRIEIDGTVHDLAKESLRVIRGVYDALANNNKQQAEKYKKLVISAALGQDGFCIFGTTSNSVCVDLSALHGPSRNGGDINGRSEEMPR